MRIRMTKSIRGSLDGVTVDDLAEGQEYDTEASARGDRMAQAHIANYVAVEVAGEEMPPAAVAQVSKVGK